MRKLCIVVVLSFTLSACGGSNAQQLSATYAAAVRAAKYMCTFVQALPDPPPATTSGGSAP